MLTSSARARCASISTGGRTAAAAGCAADWGAGAPFGPGTQNFEVMHEWNHAEIYRKAPYYPWIMDGSQPWKWKIRCPVGGEEYPSNDFARGDMTSGPFPDDGIGGGAVRFQNMYRLRR